MWLTGAELGAVGDGYGCGDLLALLEACYAHRQCWGFLPRFSASWWTNLLKFQSDAKPKFTNCYNYLNSLFVSACDALDVSCPAGTVCDYSELSQEQFWVAMARRNCLWPYKSDGSAADVHMLPGLLPQTVEGE